ncbi:hypothetical protein FB45DRAFT_915461 [Roridomyces roridus]|uniref:BTB domain-containing protein n=1 Tax=Roridomyces roridus TaxID=1738132 RepID=A0AAD7BTD8_9AGAR|nr:hypothetical protein FB45DRAFT_915461 [Roridomyces roridus]
MSAADSIQRHLYSGFVHGRVHDIVLNVRASWHATYKLHRLVLIQAGFFDSLFTAGFAESNAPKEIEIIFDDLNITRAGEFCIARLYGGGPPLHIFPSLVPSTSLPLTSAFPFTNVDPNPPPTPSGHQPGTPRFLLSLLATSVYLSIPTLTATALSAILRTVGPYTVLQYLDFALGKPIGVANSNWNEPEAAVGLENIAQLIPDNAPSDASLRSVESDETHHGEKQFHYGAISDKIGEACACWLARWAPDILALEERKAGMGDVIATMTRRRPTSSQPLPPSDYSAVPAIWDRGGLNVAWVCALVSADTLFVRGERERYDFARAVVELRRRHGILPEEEDAWKTLFEQGIHYCHLSMEDVIDLSKDSSPTTKQPFVSIAVLQASHWQNSLLRQHITARPATPASVETRPAPAPTCGSPVQRDKELGVSQTTAEIRARLATGDASLNQSGPYYLVPSDSSQRIASSLSRVSVGEANFFGIQTRRYTAQACVDADPTGTARWTLHPPFRFSAEFWDAEMLSEKARLYSRTVWCGGSLFNAYVQVVHKKGSKQLGVYLHRQSTLDVPPASAPRTDNSITSSTTSGTRERQGSLVGPRSPLTHMRGPSLPAIVQPSTSPHYSPSIHPPTRSTTPVSPSVSSSLPNSLGTSLTAHSVPIQVPASPYRDTRQSVSAYFTISCASATGASQTRFASAPDVFTVSQSWGWKSSALRTEEYIEVGEEQPRGIRGKEVSLRACVILGLV